MNDFTIKEELQAFIDGELDPARAAEFAKLVMGDSNLSANMAAFQDDKARIEQVYGPLRQLPLPERWLHTIDSRLPPKKRIFSGSFYFRPLAVAVATSLLVLVGAWFTYQRVSGAKEDTIVVEALAARHDSTQPGTAFNAASISPAYRNEILTTSLAMALKAPDLSKLGYQLEDVRVYPNVPGGKAVELSYRNTQNGVFTLYLRHPTGPPRVDLTENNGLRICLWQDDVLGAVMVGEMSAGEMARIASLAYSGLTL
jgi:anti-sigma factor RsiW